MKVIAYTFYVIGMISIVISGLSYLIDWITK